MRFSCATKVVPFLLATLLTVFYSAPAITASAQSGTIDYLVWGNATTDAVEKEVIALFEAKHPGVKVNLIDTGAAGANHLNKYFVMVAGGTPPDIALIDAYDYSTMAAQGGLYDITTLIKRDGVRLDEQFPAYVDEFTYNGRLYSIANLRGGHSIAYYNRTLFNQNGLSDPNAVNWTWQDMLVAAKRITRDTNNDGTNDIWGVQPTSYRNFIPFVWMNGGDLLDATRAKSALHEPKAMEAIQWVADLKSKYNLVGGNWLNGTMGILLEWDAVQIMNSRNQPSLDWDIAPFPAGPLGSISMLKGNELVIPASAHNKELAWEFMKFIASDEIQYLYGARGRGFPSNRKAAIRLVQELKVSSAKPDHMLSLTTMDSRVLPLRPGFREIYDTWSNELKPVWDGKKSVQDAVTQISELVDGILAKYR